MRSKGFRRFSLSALIIVVLCSIGVLITLPAGEQALGPGSGSGTGIGRAAGNSNLEAPQTGTDGPSHLVQADDLIYLGAFQVPSEDPVGASLAYGGHALTYHPANHSLFFGGHDWDQQLCEVTIPLMIDMSQTAEIVQNCADVTEGRLVEVDEGTVKLGGTLIFNDQLIISAYSYYDADGDQDRSHFVSTANLSEGGDILGPLAVGSWAGIVSGYMTEIPANWQGALGGPALTGNCCLSIISRTSFGPALSVFNPDDLGGVDPVPTIPILYYPADHPLAEWDATSPLFNGSTQIAGVAFPNGTDSVLFFGRHGTGEFCYGGGDECGDPISPYQGTHAYPYVHQIWAYDANDLFRVANGELEPWEVLPYAVWQLNDIDDFWGSDDIRSHFRSRQRPPVSHRKLRRKPSGACVRNHRRSTS